MGYWAERIDGQANILFDKTTAQTQRELAKQYKKQLRAIQLDLTALYDELIKEAADGVIKPNDLYKYNRYFKLHNTINKQLQQLGCAEVEIYNKELLRMYDGVQEIITREAPHVIANSTIIPTSGQDVLDSIWCADGKHWSQRIWGNKTKLQEQLESALMDSIVRGVSKDEAVKEFQKAFSVSFNQVDRITRTEMNYVQNQATANRYKAAGVKKYEILAAIDSRTSDICKEMNGKVFEFGKEMVGVNYPPFHPNCRTTIIPVLKEV